MVYPMDTDPLLSDKEPSTPQKKSAPAATEVSEIEKPVLQRATDAAIIAANAVEAAAGKHNDPSGKVYIMDVVHAKMEAAAHAAAIVAARG